MLATTATLLKMLLLPFDTQEILADLSKEEVLQKLAKETMNANQYIREAENSPYLSYR
jgi:hypothetical protein